MTGRMVSFCLVLLCAASAAAANDTDSPEPMPILRYDPFETPALLDQPSVEPLSVQSLDITPKPWERELRATSVSAVRSMANVDGVILMVGQELDGFRLVEVREGAVVFERDGTRQTLIMEETSLLDDMPNTAVRGRN